MKERPILFSAPMVRALLDGSKTQTRRVAKITDAGHVKEPRGHRRWHPGDPAASLACPYGQPGDRLWVRETWRANADGGFEYKACEGPMLSAFRQIFDDILKRKWKPSIHMPRAASRILLEVTAVRLERLQDISRGDAMAEGCPFQNMAQGDDPRKWFSDLWITLNGHGSWAVNPLVWVIEFKRVTP